jgi:antitoxin (DNA-binding transcriptional repressor) of toxin-antitoxin stability system
VTLGLIDSGANGMPTFNIHEAKTKLSQLVARAENGETVIIARDGKPVVRLVLEAPKTTPVFGAFKAVMVGPAPWDSFAPMDKADVDAWLDDK